MQVLVILLRSLSYIPLSVLYWVSRLLRLVLEEVIGYRKDTILQNLRRSFPERSDAEIEAIAHDYYTYLADMMVETLRLPSISKIKLRKRVTFDEPDLLKYLTAQGKNVILLMGHSGNWEWAGAATALNYDLTMLPVYRKVKDPSFDRYFRKVRSRFGSIPVLDKTAFQDIRKAPSPHAVALLADQTPSAKKGLWIEFLHQNTPFYRGTEVLTQRLSYEVLFAHVRIKGRGRYTIHLEHFTPEEDQEYDLTRNFVAFLEREIQAQPHNWLWSHKRWKHEMPEGATLVQR